ncbi:S41 family peptidase [Fulvivirga lutea]|uniref:S41 family peptidase n=1 Tax=Fulvivirga lutea TaxID=2810512 RepID=A0A974WHQ6_9BACT|nr:S41 family peptidase [Fulvivirga lutea]QSE97943.1 S41 family peptidase [Fulvivirga lutea]
MSKKKYIIGSLIIISVLLTALIQVEDRYFLIAKNIDTFASLFREVDKFYVDETDPEELLNVAVDGMLESLDPYTNYIPQKEVESFRTTTTGEYAGIGAQISSLDSGIYISMLYEGFAAHRAGLKVGDRIVKINEELVKNATVEKISNLLKGRPRTGAEIKALRVGNKDTLSFTVQREKIKVNNVPYYGMVDDHVGYIYLEDFTSGAGKEVEEALKNLKSIGAKSLILDLRNNPGGLLSEAVNVTNVFIPKNKLVVETKGKIEEWNRKYKTLNNSIDEDIPLAVLINGESASASEIVAGVIQDYDRGILVGGQTFGKGLVQTTRPLSYGGQVKITTAKYYIPSGRCIQALDYVHRDENGEAVKTPDSLKLEFRTRAGRIVYDGGGLKPDVKVKGDTYSAITIELISEAFIFHYANKYVSQNTGKQDYILSEEEYTKFREWIDNMKLQYSTNVEDELNELIANSKNEKYFNDIKSDIQKLKSDVGLNKNRDIIIHKNQIKKELEKEIALRNELGKGAIKRAIVDDQVILTAKSRLQNPDKYNYTLTKK